MADPFAGIWGNAQPAPTAQPKQPDVGDVERKAGAAELRMLGGVVQEVHDEASEALSGLKQDLTGQPNNPSDKKERDEAIKQQLEDQLFSGLPLSPRQLRTIGHATDFAFAPVTGALTATAGAGVEHATGIPRRVTGDVLSIFVPLGGEAKGEKILEEAAKDTKLGGEAAVRLFRGNPQLQRNVRDMIAAGVKPNLAVAAATRATRRTMGRAGSFHLLGGGIRAGTEQSAEEIEAARHGLAEARGGGRIASAAQAGHMVQEGVQRFAESTSPKAKAALEDMSDPVVAVLAKASRSIPARQLGFGRKADILYEHADRTVGNPKALISLSNTMEALRAFQARFSNASLKSVFDNPVVSRIFDGIRQGSGRLSWQDARNLRTEIRQRLLGDPELRATIGDKMVNDLYMALSKDLAIGAYRLGGEKAGKAYEEANRYYAAGMARIDNALTSLTGKTGDAAYADIIRMAQEGSKRDLQRLTQIRNSLKPDEWRDLSATVLEHMGLAKAGMATSQTEFSLQTFLTNFNKLDTRVGERSDSGVDSALKLFFQGADRAGDYDKLRAIANSAGMWQELRKFENMSRSGEAALTGGEIAMLVAGGHFAPLPTIIALTGGRAASAALMSERFVRWLAKLPQKGGVEEIDKAIEDLGKEAKADPSLRPIYHYLGSQLAQATEGAHRLTEDVHSAPPVDKQPAGSPGAPAKAGGPDPFSDIWSGKGAPQQPSADKPGTDAEPIAYESNDQVADYLQHHLGFPVRITSGARDAAHNREVGGAEHSQHLKGEAWDFVPQGVGIAEAARQVVDSGMQFDQLEITPTHLHISFDPQNRHSIIYGGRELALVNPDHFGGGQIENMQGNDDVDWGGIDGQ